MVTRMKWKIAALATTALFPVGALAQDFGVEEAPAEEAAPVFSNYIELGGDYQTDDSYRFGRYTGAGDEGFGVIGEIDVLRRPAMDDDSTEYFRLHGTGLGGDTRRVDAEYGHQGDFRVRLHYDETPFLQWDDAVTPYLGAGGNVLALPPGWTAATTPAALTAANPTAFRDVNIETKRTEYGASGTLNLGGGWSVSTAYEHEVKEGTMTKGVAWGTNGGNPSAVIAPEPVDYTTDRFKAAVNYNARRMQLEASYHLSMFDEENDSFFVQNPYSDRAGGAPWNLAGAYPAYAQMSLPPDNSAHEFRVSAGYDMTSTSRITANLAYSKHYQDEDFLPITAVPGLVVTTPLPRNSLDGEVTNWMANFEYFNRISDTFDVRAKYRFIDRDDETAQDVFTYITGDIEDQQAAPTSKARINHPYSFTNHQATLEGTYRIAPRTRLNGGYTYELAERTHSEVEENTEHTVFARVRSSLGQNVWGSLGYSHGWRDSSTYVGNRPFLEGHTPAYIATLAGVQLWENHPLLRKFFEAERDRDRVNGSISFAATDRATIGVSGTWMRDDYGDSELGLTESSGYTVTGDLGYQFSDVLSGHAFYSYEDHKTEQAGWSFTGAAKAVQSADPTRRWWATHDDTVHTAGVGLEWQPLPQWSLGADYAYHDATTAISMDDAGAFNLIDFPDIETRVHTINLSAAYALRENIDLRVQYAFENYDSEDWQVDAAAPDASGRVLAMGVTSPDYDVHVIGISARYKF